MPLEYQGSQTHSARMTDPAQARANLRAWILTKNDEADPRELSDQTPLLVAGWLRSIHLPELILMLERWRGEPVDVTDLGPGDFRDVETIVSRFVISAREPGTGS